MNRAAVKLACLDSLVGFASVKRYDPVKELVSKYTLKFYLIQCYKQLDDHKLF